MRMYVFKSQAKNAMHAFTGDSAGSKLPERHGPWKATGVVGAERDPPHGLPRDRIEELIRDQGFQLWRKRRKKQ